MGQTWQGTRRPPGKGDPVAENAATVRRPAARGGRLAPLALLGLAVVVAAGVVAWLLLRGTGGGGVAVQPATLVSQAQLQQLAASVDHPVYWAGPKSGYSYELTTTSNGRFYVRYLPAGVKAGDTRPKTLPIGNGGLALFSSKAPTSAYFSYPDAKYQVEVYDPSGDHARKLVVAGQIVPIK